MNADCLFIEDFTVDAIIGILPHEREQKQPVIFDLELFVDTRPAANSEAIEDAVDYFALTEQLREFVASSDYFLIEKLATATAGYLLQHFPLQRVKIRLSKPKALTTAKNVGVIIERSRDFAST